MASLMAQQRSCRAASEVLLRDPQCSRSLPVCQGALIRPELDQFWWSFLLTYLLPNLDKKHTPLCGPATPTPDLLIQDDGRTSNMIREFSFILC